MPCKPLLVLFAAGLAAQGPAEFAQQSEFVQSFCFDCHGGDTTKGKFDLSVAPADSSAALWRWSRMRERALAGEMPPLGADEPSAEERAAFVRSADATLLAEVPKLPPQPGRVTIRRLSRAQWESSVHDLLGVSVSTGAFPADDLGYGFDTIGDAMTFSTLHLENYLAAAGEVASQVFGDEDPLHPTVRRFEAEAMRIVQGSLILQDGDEAAFLSNGAIEQSVRLPRDGTYRLRVSASGDQGGDEPPKMLLRCDDRDLDTFDVTSRRAADFEISLPLSGGEHRFAIAFLNDFYEPKNPDPKRRDRNLHVDSCEVIGPLEPRVVPPQQDWLQRAIAAEGDDTTKITAIARVLLSQVWRRPVSVEELDRMSRLAESVRREGSSLDVALRVLLQAALASPNFLFRVEAGAVAGEEVAGEQVASGIAPVPPHELASRLSYFLWSSTPDARLLELAASGQLADPAVRAGEVQRLLADPRADSLATDFAAQWFELRNLWVRTPDPERFPGFDDGLRSSLRRETELLFLAVFREQRDVRDLLDCDFTHLDARLAQFYGIPLPGPGEGFQRVQLAEDQRERGGILGHGSVLVVTSSPTRTSPVKRGRWILDNLLGQPPPPPQPGSDSFANEKAIDSTKTLREQLAQHRERTECAVCHVRMDALGFALERFDAIGRYRTEDAGGPIDCRGELPGGRRIDGLADLKAVLKGDPAFVRLAAKKLFVYALGRDPRPVDRLKLDYAVNALIARGKVTIADLVVTIVQSEAFLLRSVEQVR
jgi:hypothetical protein